MSHKLWVLWHTWILSLPGRYPLLFHTISDILELHCGAQPKQILLGQLTCLRRTTAQQQANWQRFDLVAASGICADSEAVCSSQQRKKKKGRELDKSKNANFFFFNLCSKCGAKLNKTILTHSSICSDFFACFLFFFLFCLQSILTSAASCKSSTSMWKYRKCLTAKKSYQMNLRGSTCL